MSGSFRRLFSCFGAAALPSAKPDPRPLLKLRERLEELMEQANKLSTEEDDLKGLEFAINQFQKAADYCSQLTAECVPVERAVMEVQKELESGKISDHVILDPAFEKFKSDAEGLQVKIGECLADVDEDSASDGGLLRDHHHGGA